MKSASRTLIVLPTSARGAGAELTVRTRTEHTRFANKLSRDMAVGGSPHSASSASEPFQQRIGNLYCAALVTIARP